MLLAQRMMAVVAALAGAALLSSETTAVSLASGGPPAEPDSGADGTEVATAKGQSRGGYNGKPLECVPSWLIAMSCGRRSFNHDQYLCGLGIRLSGGFYLTMNAAGLRVMMDIDILDGVRDINIVYGPPGFFVYPMPRYINISQPNLNNWYWVPKFIKTYMEGLAIYRVSLKDDRPGSKERNLFQDYPQEDLPPLEMNLKAPAINCWLITYAGDYASQKVVSSRALSVSRRRCELNTCFFSGWEDPLFFDDYISNGILCGRYSNLGAPILCGPDGNQNIHYMFSDPGVSECTQLFKAVRVARFAKEIIADIENLTAKVVKLAGSEMGTELPTTLPSRRLSESRHAIQA